MAVWDSQKGLNVRFITTANLTLQLEKSRPKDSFQQNVHRVDLEPRLLAMDKIGSLPSKTPQADLFSQVVVQRYERGSVILNSNPSFEDWEESFA